MKFEYLDQETIQAYHRDKLWKDDDFYVSFLENVVNQPQNTHAIAYAKRMVEFRQKFILSKTFGEDGSVNVRIVPIWSNIFKRVLRYLPGTDSPRIEDL